MFIGLHAKKQSGKDTLAAMIASRWSFGSVAFADPLYAGLRAIFPHIPTVCWMDRNLPIPYVGRTVNQLLQSLGTEWGRGHVREDIWVDMACRTAHEQIQANPELRGVVFRDVRYNNEARFIKESGGVIILIDSPRGMVINDHSSERGISPEYITYTVENGGTTEELWQQFAALGIPH